LSVRIPELHCAAVIVVSGLGDNVTVTEPADGNRADEWALPGPPDAAIA
jgi:hypothetical protein